MSIFPAQAARTGPPGCSAGQLSCAGTCRSLLESPPHQFHPPFAATAPSAVTHAHADHVGALPALQQAFPGTPIVLHADEAPFLLGHEQYVPPGSAVLAALRAVGLAATSSVQARSQFLAVAALPGCAAPWMCSALL